MNKLQKAIREAGKKDPIKETVLHKSLEDVGAKINKYHVSERAERTYSDGTVFDSRREMNRWHYLLMAQKAGEIENLRRQVPFELQEEFGSKQHGQIKPIVYYADFVYDNISLHKGLADRAVVEDVKGVKTKEYSIKRKMLLYKFGEMLFFEV